MSENKLSPEKVKEIQIDAEQHIPFKPMLNKKGEIIEARVGQKNPPGFNVWKNKLRFYINGAIREAEKSASIIAAKDAEIERLKKELEESQKEVIGLEMDVAALKAGTYPTYNESNKKEA